MKLLFWTTFFSCVVLLLLCCSNIIQTRPSVYQTKREIIKEQKAERMINRIERQSDQVNNEHFYDSDSGDKRQSDINEVIIDDSIEIQNDPVK